MKIYNGYSRLPRNYALMTDEYEFTMANGYLLCGKQDQEAVFDVFFRTIPNGGGYAVMAGLDKVIPFIQGLRFGEQELDYFKRKGYGEDFINYMKDFRFTGDIYAIPDGTPVFPNDPLITVKAPLIQAQIVETALLSMINGAMEHATGARRIIEATPPGVTVMEFGARRADGCEAAVDASIYGIMAGCVGTSNDLAADMLNMKGMGTQAHSWVESYPSEYEAFLAYAKA
ncbi:MAG: nicotinate phosphoribosyltransferase, partial [Firmicutes bacterium]|nr:nicotinate phosphoribosyltransferase [Bacillota bacterium]